MILTEAQVRALEKAKEETETEHPGYLGAQDTFYVGTLKDVGRIYQQTFREAKHLADEKMLDRPMPLWV